MKSPQHPVPVALLVSFLLLALSGRSQSAWTGWTRPLDSIPQKEGYVPGSFRMDKLLPLVQGKKIAMVINHTARFRGRHLVDTLLQSGIRIVTIFAPEHGFRGTQAAGETVVSGVDPKTGIPLISLYGKTKKPTAEMLKEVDLVVFDIQDVGARFYTYISTMKGVMEACAENNRPILICDRANPLGFCTGGPILEKKLESFVGAFPIPVVHGLTVGELAGMAVGKRWFKGAEKLKWTVIPCLGYRHRDTIFPEVPPSPNLNTPLSVLAYPSLCLFEGTTWSVGRGTPFPFQVFGYPDSSAGSFSFQPARQDSLQPKPLYSGITCFGSRLNPDSLTSCFTIRFIIQAWKRNPSGKPFFNSFFPKLAGVSGLEDWVRKGVEPEFDQSKWRRKRRPFLLYPED